MQNPLIVEEQTTHVAEEALHMTLPGERLKHSHSLGHTILAGSDCLESCENDWNALDLGVG